MRMLAKNLSWSARLQDAQIIKHLYMNAHAHLKGLGWRGEGHSLDTSDRGLKRPLLISHKYDVHGLGSKNHKEKQADQWWLNAFDNALRDIGSGKESSLGKIQQDGLGKASGLYGFFVRGRGLEGTFDLSGSGTCTPIIVNAVEDGATGSKARLGTLAKKMKAKKKSKKTEDDMEGGKVKKGKKERVHDTILDQNYAEKRKDQDVQVEDSTNDTKSLELRRVAKEKRRRRREEKNGRTPDTGGEDKRRRKLDRKEKRRQEKETRRMESSKTG